jgi:hypothetical protein
MQRRITLGAILGLVAALWLAAPALATGYCEQGQHSCTTTTTGQETTTTSGEETTTTLDETTTTMDEGTTTTLGENTTTTIENGAFWSASSECQTLTAEWGEGISSVNVYLMDPQFGEIQVDGFTEPGTLDATTAKGGEWVLVPVVFSGFTPVPDQIILFTEVCAETTTSTGPTGSTLPFTGMSEFMWTTMIFVAAVSGVLGFVLVMSGRDEE